MNIEPDYRKAIHFKPSAKNSNARCLNGSAHIRKTTDIKRVNCAKCLDEKTGENYWNHFFYLDSLTPSEKLKYYRNEKI